MKTEAGIFLLCLSLFSIAQAATPVDLDAKYSCVVTASNDPGIPVGAVPLAQPLTLGGIETSGFIATAKGSIDFYGPLTELDAFQPNSGYTVFAKTYGEEQGSLFIMPQPDGSIDLSILVVHVAVSEGFDKTTGQAVPLLINLPELYVSAPQLYTLNCKTL